MGATVRRVDPVGKLRAESPGSALLCEHNKCPWDNAGVLMTFIGE